ncbi:MAG: hypothetical protein J6Y89_02635, partial [Lachnospiraceae bacterium]|nr:hypothetical protein [Lachnospiraceae bacterium]
SGSGSGSTSGSGSSGSGSGDASTTETTQGFTLDYVYSNLAAGKKFQFRIIGTAGTANERGCKPVKVAVKKAAKGITKLTLDVSANAAPIKNGYDFAVYKVPAAASGSGSGSTSGSGNGAGSGSGDAATKAPTTPDEGGINTWYTILPYNKEATVTDYIIPTGDFTPYKKFDSEKVTVANMFTKVKVKFVSVNDLFRLAEADKNTDSLYLYIRKSAAVGKPAGLWSSKFDVSSIAGKPVPDLLKAGETTIATKTEKEMYQAKFSAASGDTGTAFEILVINAADKAKLDDGKIDMTTAKWTKYNATKGFKLGIKSKYGEIGEKAENHELADGDYILVRRAGVKKKTLASEYVVTKISGDNWVVDKLTDGKAPAGSTSGSGSSTSGSSTSGGGTSSGS